MKKLLFIHLMFMSKDLNELVDILNNQWDDWSNIDVSIWKQIYSNFPEFRYQGQAYRSVILDGQEFKDSLNLIEGISWSKDKEGIKEFLQGMYIEFLALTKSNEVVLIHGDVDGVDLEKICKTLLELGLSVESRFLSEKEVISLNSKIITSTTNALKDFVNLDSTDQ